MTPHDTAVLLFALGAIAVLITLIGVVKLHPFVALVITSLGLGLAVHLQPAAIVQTFEEGVGYTLGHVAIVVALGTILGKLLAESGGADAIARKLVSLAGPRGVPWAMLAVGIVTGLPVFFEVGFVLMIPIAFTVARRSNRSVISTALPLLAGLSVVHAMVPPHPAAMAAVVLYQANIGRTLGYALLVGIPSAVLAGPVYASFIAPRISPAKDNAIAEQFLEQEDSASKASFLLALLTIMLPIVLMLVGGWVDAFTAKGSMLNATVHFIGNPDVALLIGVLFASITLLVTRGIKLQQMQHWASDGLPSIAGALLLIGAGGGFGKMLQVSGAGNAILHLATQTHFSLLLMAWLIAALLRIGVGSSTVAMTTAASIIAPAMHASGVHPELLVIATGAGSIVLSHVNDGGFWLVESYLGLSVKDTLKTWTVLETILSVSGLIFVLLVAAI
jgi:GntP family gluconate:H+ symporter